MTGPETFRRLAAPFITPAAAASHGLRAAFDIETDGLIDVVTTVHCVVVADLDSDAVTAYGPDEIPVALEHLGRAEYLVGHNIQSFDLEVLRRLFAWKPAPGCRIIDTLIVGRLILPHLSALDDKVGGITGQTLGKLRGRYSLEAWGCRLGIAKAGTEIADWSVWTQAMQDRCVSDVKINMALWQFLQPDGYAQSAVELEHRAAAICARISSDGVPFCVAAAQRLAEDWKARRAPLEAALHRQFPGANVNSNKQLAALLQARGWMAAKCTPKTRQPKIDDEVLEALPASYPEFAGLAEYRLLGRRLAALATGREAWLKNVRADGRIHGSIVHIGTPHSRASHLKPNLAQVPNAKKGAPFAAECRDLFHAPPGWVFVASDQAGLQDRGLAHYLTPHDDGAYAKTFIDGTTDTHWKSAIALGLVADGTERDKNDKIHTAIREGAKRFRYAFLYGVGRATAGHIVRDTARNVAALDPANALHRTFFGNTAHPTEAALVRVGAKALRNFLSGQPGLAALKEKLEKHTKRFCWLPGLDGRRVPAVAQHTLLNYVVTSSEAIICKTWLVETHDELAARFRYGWEGDVVLVLWVHDELVACVRPEIAEAVGEVMARHGRTSGERYGFRVPLVADYHIRPTWAEKTPEKPVVPTPPLDGIELEVAAISADEQQAYVQRRMREEGIPWDRPPAAHATTTATTAMAAVTVKSQPQFPPPPENDDDHHSEHRRGDGDDHRGDVRGNGAGYTWAEGDDKPNGEARRGRVIATYLYRDHLGRPHTKVEKRQPAGGGRKQYPQSFWSGGAWIGRKPPGWTKVPYRLPELMAALAAQSNDLTVHLPEGEKDADTLAGLGLVASTSSEGATNPKSRKGSNWTAELSRWFHGVARVFIPEDNDEPGRHFAREKAQALADIVADIRIVSFPDVPPGEDVSYWIHELKHSKDEYLARCAAAPRWNSANSLETIRFSGIEMEVHEWLWPERFALGEIGLIVGMPDEGKGQVLAYITAQVTRGGAWPNGEGTAPLGRVLLLGSEDSLAKTVAPRLAAAGADLDRVEAVPMVPDTDLKSGLTRKRLLSLVTDLERLRRKVVELGDVKAILIDPISAYLGVGVVDSFRATDVRAVLGPLKELAEELGIAIIALMHFNKKVDVNNILLRVSDSLAFVAAPRAVFGVVDDRDNGRKLVVRAKNNLASDDQKRKTLAYHFAVKQVGTDARNGKPITAPHIVWEPGYVDISATDALSAVNENKSPSAVDDAKQFLREMLCAAGGRMAQNDVMEAAEAEMIAPRTLHRAKKALGIRSEKDRTPEGKWTWSMPGDADGF
jgi:DNA polymerase I-like protein with 3'-5' exonuclease and polymerase domains